jgi:uncharacterized membrane protein (Fun14 family)
MSGEVAEPEDADQAALLSMYDQLRQEVRAHGKRKTRRNLGSFTVVGLIVGYIFTSNGDARVLVLVPYVLAFLYLAHISSVNYVIQLAALLALIEREIDSLGAEYEYYHGGLDIKTSPRFDDVDRVDQSQEELQNTIQSRVRCTMNILAVVAYFGATLGGLVVLLTQGLPDLGLTSSPWESLWSLPIIAAILLMTQILLFYPIVSSWRAYRKHREVLIGGVRGASGHELYASIKRLEADDDNADS